MGTITVSHHINAPAEQVWDAITDFENAADRISGITRMEMLSDCTAGVGTKWRETRIMMKKQATEVMEITEWDAPNSYVVEAESCGCHYRTVMSVKPTDDGTGGCILQMDMHSTPVKFAAKVMMPIMGLMMTGACKKMIKKDFIDIEQSLAGSGVQPA